MTFKERFSRLWKPLYSAVMILVALIMVIFTFVDVGGTSGRSNVDKDSMYKYIEDLSGEPHPYGDWNYRNHLDELWLNECLYGVGEKSKSEIFDAAHEANRTYLVDTLKSFGLKEAEYTTQATDAEIYKNSLRFYLEGETDLSPENAPNIDDSKFPSDFAIMPDAPFKDSEKQRFVAEFVAATQRIEELKILVKSVEPQTDPWYNIRDELHGLLSAIAQTQIGNVAVGSNYMPQFPTTVEPFVIEYDRYITQQDANDLSVLAGENPWGSSDNEVNDYLRNVIAYFPSSETIEKGEATTSDILTFICHYDSVDYGPGAADDNAAVGALLASAKALMQNYVGGENDICFIWTDAEEKGLWGMKSIYFLDSMADFYSRIKLMFNFEARGTSGTLAMFETSQNNSELMGVYASKVNKTVYSSSLATFIYSLLSNTTDMEFVLDVAENLGEGSAVLNFASIGSAEYYHSENDNYENLQKTIPTQIAAVVMNGINAFANYDLSGLTSNTSDAIYFSYYDLWMVSYSPAWSYILVGIVIILLGLVIFFSIKNKKFSYIKMLKGLAVQVISIVAGALIFFAGGMLVYLLGRGGAGVADGGLFAFIYTFSNPWLVFLFAVIATVEAYFIYKKLNKLLKIEGKDVVRASNFVIVAVGVVLTFALPQAGYLFIFAGLLALTVMLIEILLGKRFEDKTGHNFDSLMLYALPFVLCLFMPLSIGLMATEAIGHMAYVIVGIFYMLMVGTFLPALSVKEVYNSFKTAFKKQENSGTQQTVEQTESTTEQNNA